MGFFWGGGALSMQYIARMTLIHLCQILKACGNLTSHPVELDLKHCLDFVSTLGLLRDCGIEKGLWVMLGVFSVCGLVRGDFWIGKKVTQLPSAQMTRSEHSAKN